MATPIPWDICNKYVSKSLPRIEKLGRDEISMEIIKLGSVRGDAKRVSLTIYIRRPAGSQNYVEIVASALPFHHRGLILLHHVHIKTFATVERNGKREELSPNNGFEIAHNLLENMPVCVFEYNAKQILADITCGASGMNMRVEDPPKPPEPPKPPSRRKQVLMTDFCLAVFGITFFMFLMGYTHP